MPSFPSVCVYLQLKLHRSLLLTSRLLFARLESPFRYRELLLYNQTVSGTLVTSFPCSRCRYGILSSLLSVLSREDSLTCPYGSVAGLDTEGHLCLPLVTGLFVFGASSAPGEALLRSSPCLATHTTFTTYILSHRSLPHS